MREDQAADGETAAAEPTPPVAEGGPLRGEKPTDSPVDERGGQRAAGAGASGRPKAVEGEKAQQRRRVRPSDDLGLRVALGPVAGLWERLSGWQQDRVEAAAKAQVKRLAGMLVRPETAPQLLADRLTDRPEETGGEALVTGPFGWLTHRGLVQRPACSDWRCDDGIRLDTSGDCGSCGNVVHLRRARRARIAAEVDRELPGLGERRQVLEERLRAQAAIEAEALVRRREQAAAEEARRDAARAAAQERDQCERQAAAADAELRQALPCEDCGQDRSAGLCEACGYRRRTEALTVEAGMIAATWSADLDDPGDVAAVAAHVRAALKADIAKARRDFLELVEPGELDEDPTLAASAIAFAALQAVQQALPEYRSSALNRLGRTEEAEAEARRAYATEQNRRWYKHAPTGADAIAAATKAAGSALHSTCSRRALSSCASRPPPAPRRLRPRRGRTGCPTLLCARCTATRPRRCSHDRQAERGRPRTPGPDRRPEGDEEERRHPGLRSRSGAPARSYAVTAANRSGSAIGIMMTERGMAAPAGSPPLSGGEPRSRAPSAWPRACSPRERRRVLTAWEPAPYSACRRRSQRSVSPFHSEAA
ncbi:hypothetical protein [Streptomyces lydicus]|uniref:hypothetical protein n=1 Tax=Streptomyces lydicus TaxID=47763 RepID=UPI0037A6AC5B